MKQQGKKRREATLRRKSRQSGRRLWEWLSVRGGMFTLSYLTILLAVALGGGLIVQHLCDALWEAKKERLLTAASYAADSLLSFAELSGGVIEGAQRASALSQLTAVMDETVSGVQIREVTAENETALLENAGELQILWEEDPKLSRGSMTTVKDPIRPLFEREAGLLATVRLSTGARLYDLILWSEDRDLSSECDRLWRRYQIIAGMIALISGSFLLALWRVYDEARRRNRFLADFTHEMKTPMTAIMGYARMLRSYTLTGDERRDAGEAIYREAKRLEELSRRLLELYVLQHETPKLTPVRLSLLQESMAGTLSFLSEKYHVTFQTALPEVTVLSEKTLLLSLFYNLSENAAKASPYGAGIWIGAEEAADAVRLFVKDEGYGIEKEHLNRLTEPFYREDRARSRKQGGAGLGLSLCSEIAALHGSRLMIESEKGVGTTVSLQLRREKDA